jgi:hypothetical protein
VRDRILRDGLVNHLIPLACASVPLWFPSIPSQMTLPNQYEFEYQVAGELVAIIREQTGFELPVNEVPNVAMLLRAAFIRARPYSFRRVIVVCPSGMATAQLLVARLEARFPRLGNLEIVSLRQLNLDRGFGRIDLDHRTTAEKPGRKGPSPSSTSTAHARGRRRHHPVSELSVFPIGISVTLRALLSKRKTAVFRSLFSLSIKEQT